MNETDARNYVYAVGETNWQQYQGKKPNQVLTKEIIQTYFQQEREKGRTPEQIYRNNSFMVKTIAYTPPPAKLTPNFTVAAVIPALSTAYTWNVPFRTGLTDKQKDSITNLLTNRTNSGEMLDETDARNYAYAVGRTDWGQYVDKKPVEVLKKEIIGTIVQTVQALSPLLGQYTVSPTAIPTTMAISTTALVGQTDPLTEYIKDGAEQIVLGNYTPKVTLLGTLGQIGLGLFGVDIPGDIRDIYYRLTHREDSKEHPVATTLDVVGVLPLIGALKYGDEVGALLKQTKSVQILDVGQRAVKKIEDIKGFTEHGLDQIITRTVKPEFIKDAIENTKGYIKRIDGQGRESFRYIGEKAVVNFNSAREIITVWLK